MQISSLARFSLGWINYQSLRSRLSARTTALSVVGTLLLSGLVRADDIPLDHLPADASMIIHLDLANKSDCEVLDNAVTDIAETPAVKTILDAIPPELEFARQAHWRDITIFQDESSQESVVLIHSDSLAEGFEEYCEQSSSFESISFDEYVLYQVDIDREALTEQLGFDIAGSQSSPDNKTSSTVFVGRSKDRLVASSDLDSVLATFDRVADESLQLREEAFHELCGIEARQPVLTVVIAPGGDEGQQELLDGLEGLCLVMESGPELELQLHASMTDESYAESYEAWIKSDALTKVFSLLVAASKRQKESGEETNKVESETPTKNQITFGLSFKGDKEGQFTDELGTFLKQSLTCTTSGSVLQLHWKSPARVKTDIEVEGGHLSINVFAEVHNGEAEEVRVADGDKENGGVDR